MSLKRREWSVVFLFIALSGIWAVAPALAQGTANPAAPNTPKTNERMEGDGYRMDGSGQPVPVVADSTSRSILRIAAELTRLTDVPVLADRSVASLKVTPPDSSVTAANIEQTLNIIVRDLPKGTLWAKVFLPASTPKGGATRWNPDSLADYVLLQADLFGSSTGSPPAGTIEIMGKRLGGDDAATVTRALNLQPVYILFNPMRRDILTGVTLTESGSRQSDETKAASTRRAAEVRRQK